MIVKLKDIPLNTPRSPGLRDREFQHRRHLAVRIATSEPLKVEFKQVLYALPLLFLAGVFTGIAIMLLSQT